MNTGRLNRGNRTAGRMLGLGVLMVVAGSAAMRAAEPWVAPTPEELAMTSLPGYPGAPAVILFREQITKDDLHVVQHYERIKVLTEKGKDQANVELRFASSSGDGYYESGDDKNITDIAGRTIHPDGTIIPFTGKPYLKTMQKGKSFKYQARVFTLPDVEVGSIIEFRYATRISDYVVEAPDWYIQDDLFTKAAHFAWYPTNRDLGSSDGGVVNSITCFPILPAGVTVSQVERPIPGVGNQTQRIYEVTAHDVAPQPDEEYMPPVKSLTYRVLFSYTGFRTSAEFWKGEGKKWSKREDTFIGPDAYLKTAAQKAIGDARTQDEQLRKIYAAVMALENTDYTRDHGRKEDQAAGVAKVVTAGDVLKRGRGTSDQLTDVFVGMARGVGMKAYLMVVPDRSKRLLMPGWMSFGQFDDSIAIVNVDGKEQFFDPGQRYCQYGRLAWVDSYSRGLRQVEGGTDFATAPGDNYTDTKTLRVADLSMGQQGDVSGPITITYSGATALRWRQKALTGDEESLSHGLRTELEEMLPKSMEVKFVSVDNLVDYEKPLVAHFDVKGGLGTPTGKRMILPVDVFLAEDTVAFPHEKRELPIYFEFPQTIKDAMRIKFPADMGIEALPDAKNMLFQDLGQYNLTVAGTPHTFTTQRNFVFNTIIVPLKDYGELRKFYTEMETKDKDSVVLKAAADGATAGN